MSEPTSPGETSKPHPLGRPDPEGERRAMSPLGSFLQVSVNGEATTFSIQDLPLVTAEALNAELAKAGVTGVHVLTSTELRERAAKQAEEQAKATLRSYERVAAAFRDWTPSGVVRFTSVSGLHELHGKRRNHRRSVVAIKVLQWCKAIAEQTIVTCNEDGSIEIMIVDQYLD